MGDKSKIEWTDATWNPVTGCTKVSQGCKFCYAERVFSRPYPGRAFTDVRCHPERLDQPLKWKSPRRIFVNSMSDLFHEAVPMEFIMRVIAKMAVCPQHTFQTLTKRPERMMSVLSGVPSIAAFNNLWWGVSVEDQKTADERIPLLLQTPAAVRWVSYEPALGPVDFSRFLPVETIGGVKMERWLDWIVAGGESGPHARPAHPDWFRQVRDQCQAAGAPFFFKQWGEWAPLEIAGTDESGNWKPIAGRQATARIKDWDDGQIMFNIGKKAAGRLLDGREWNEFSEVK